MTRRMTTMLLGFVAYTYIGYPAAVIAMSRIRPERRPVLQPLPRISVIVAALNEEEVIEAKVANLLAQDYPADCLEVIVVADGSSDLTAQRAAASGDARVRVLSHAVRRGKAAAMGRGAEHATGEILVFTDANNALTHNALRALVSAFGDPAVMAASGAKTVAGASAASAGERLYWRYESAIKKAESRNGFCTAAIGELMAVRRDAMPTFPVGLVNDDFYLAMHVARNPGQRLAYVPEAVSVEPPAASERDEAVRRRRIAAGRWQALSWGARMVPVQRPLVAWQVASHKYARLALPFAMAAALASSAIDVASGRRGSARPLLAAQLAFYGLAAVGPRLPGPSIVRQLGGAARYITASNIAVAWGLRDFIAQRDQLHLWERARPTDSTEEEAA